MDLQRQLASIVAPDRVLARTLDRIAFANDASVYRLVPRAVVLPTSIDEVRSLLAFSRKHRIPLTFRAAGTSLSGQAVTDGLLVVVSRHWRGVEVRDGGRRVGVQPGVIGGDVNRRLAGYGTKIGPDPASIDACMMGGILANNSSGMCCGVVNNAYHTLESMTFVLADGTIIDTSDPGSRAMLRRESPRVSAGLLDLKRRIEADSNLRDRIRAKYRVKNTMGYSINAFLDYAEPLDILAHLMIGSEGTLGFIAEAELRTVPDPPHRSTGLLFFQDVPRACAAISALRDSGAGALELMDRASLRAVEDQPGVPSEIRALPETAAALLVEYQCATVADLDRCRRDSERLMSRLPLVAETRLTDDPERQAALWRVRRGLIPSVGAMRGRGTSFIIEDVVFPVERLADGVAELQGLFRKHRYDDAIVFGHARDGNLHFVLTQAFQHSADVERYDAFMQALSDLVAVRYCGSLKAEHGTGRNMAPFVETEWGTDAYRIMQEIKRLVDPEGLLNPGVILNDDPQAHVTHLKPLPTVEPVVDACIECGFCERMCPSRDLTLTPRQRIVVRREIARLREVAPDSPLIAELEADYRYDAIATCATDGLCATACPVGIDTGRLVKELRRKSRSAGHHELARILAERFGLLESGMRLALAAGAIGRRVVSDGAMRSATLFARRLVGSTVPLWSADIPRPAGALPLAPLDRSSHGVYFPTCVTRTLGAPPSNGNERTLPDVVLAVSRRAGLRLGIPTDVRGTCCGLTFSSRGLDRAYRRAANDVVDALWRWSHEGLLPIVVDASPCADTLRRSGPELEPARRSRLEQLTIQDGVEFAHDRVLPLLRPTRRTGAVALHPVCSVTRMGTTGKFLRLAEACAEAVEVPEGSGCCGFAGDRGFSVPELTAAATRPVVEQIQRGSHVGYYSSSRTCEIGLARATGKPYRSFWRLLDEATR